MVEQLIRNQQVVGSSPIFSSIYTLRLMPRVFLFWVTQIYKKSKLLSNYIHYTLKKYLNQAFYYKDNAVFKINYFAF